ncbi:MAG TPA: Dethiobiotin synthetase [Oscillatoriales cyanobacterium M59_W2019_021]|nr:Dethiobiotin synthetase [Oscillatoriales cyanobacterium M4454_W2019_049]HIK50599.1 Dethiobiotin synthetase [Oscillatoriales cyanobacterium M59_W2019_021]
MNPKTACNFLIDQGMALITQRNPDAFLCLLAKGESPYPGQMTSILLALKTVRDALGDAKQIDRPLADALHRLAMESHKHYEAGRRNGVQWSPLLAEDLQRLEDAVCGIFSGEGQGSFESNK